MTLAADLRLVAQDQASGSTPAHWRRAVSTAYYAVFHLLLEEATTLFGLDGALATPVQRSFDHKEMSKVSRQFASAWKEGIPSIGRIPVPTDLVQFVLRFNELQVARAEADYDTGSGKVTQSWARDLVEEAETAFDCWGRVRTDKHTRLYLLLLLASKVVKPRD